jgi:GTP-binding protein HflX
LVLEIAGSETVTVRDRQAKYGVGTGKASGLAEKASALEADCMVFDWNPSPSQQRNWEELAGFPILDRQEVIIRIFAQRAATREAELQVKLAELEYRLPRLTHRYLDLSRQRGGRYGTRGAGETRLETDRRLVERQITGLERELGKIAGQRRVQRRQRQRQELPVCAIAGYTNAGKSSLMNALSGADVLTADKLFATLDATVRRFEPEPGMAALLVDTVGFIRQLPHSLIKAFRSTLEEAALADILIHVLDGASPDIENAHQTTLAVLRELGAENIPVITVLNKTDRLDAAQTEALQAQFSGCIAISAKNGAGLAELKKQIAVMLKAKKSRLADRDEVLQ